MIRASLIWNPLQKVGAWYDRRLRLRASEVSAELVEFARASSRTVHPWNDLADIEMPGWVDRTGGLDDCVCFWLYDDGASSDDLARIAGG